MTPTRTDIIPEPRLPDRRLLAERGRARARLVQVVAGPFLKAAGVASEAAFKRQAAADRRIMAHAQIGYRDPARSREAMREVFERCGERGHGIDRFGICLDWSMGVPRDQRSRMIAGTGLILDGPEDFARLAEAAAAAPHFGDFVLGFPAAVENTEAALMAGSTSIGNLGQFFTFRLQGFSDDVACTEATLTALHLIAAQDREVLVHSNLDDGFAGLFSDMSSILGAALLERHIAGLVGVPLSHCYGHHFSDPLSRLAFHLALARASDVPGTMIYGNTTGYRGNREENFASLASYLLTDICGQMLVPSGHAVNPVPVSENERIPDVDEIVAAQLFARRLIEHAPAHAGMIDLAKAEAMADRIAAGAKRFRARALDGLAAAGIDTSDPFEMLLALRRLGARGLERLFGARAGEDTVELPIVGETREMARVHLARINPVDRAALAGAAPLVVTAASDVHAHGKMVLDAVLEAAGARLVDGGTSASPEVLAALVRQHRAQAVAVSTYNGIALSYYKALRAELGTSIPVLIGGRLNQIPDSSNTSLPVDVGGALEAAGALVCRDIEDAVPALLAATREMA